MGIWAAIKSFGKSVVNVAKDVIDFAVDAHKAYTGQDKFEEADRLYKEVMANFEEHRRTYTAKVEQLSKQIKKEVEEINQAKVAIKTELFPEFAQKIARIKDVNISDEMIRDCFEQAELSFDSPKSRDELFLIDFNKNPILSNFKAAISMGFWSRKQAKETLLKVKEEKKRVDEEIERMESELEKLYRLEESLRQTASYFNSIICIYRRMLLRLDNSINFLIVRSIAHSHTIVSKDICVRNLPVCQQKELKATVTMSSIMKKMVETKILLDSSKDSVWNVKSDLEDKSIEVRQLYEAA